MKFKDIKRRYISRFTRFSVCLFAFCAIAKLIAVIFPSFADFFNRYVSGFTRGLLGTVTSILPFSLAELIIITVIPLSFIYLLYCLFNLLNTDKLTKHLFNLVGVICMICSLFILNLGIAYDCTPLEDKADLDTENLTAEDVFDACIIVLDELREIEDTLPRDESGAAVSPYTFSEVTKKLNASYKNLYRDYPFLSHIYVSPKRVALSKPMTYTGISGVYTFFTGEANVNTNFPSYSVTFTAAHEMAHQRGVAPEDEANFMAFLACYTSSDSYLKYCSLVEIANFLTNTLYHKDRALFEEARSYFSEETIDEYRNYSENYEPYRDNIVNDAASEINDTYLKAQGQKDGIASYSLVSALAAAYILKTH